MRVSTVLILILACLALAQSRAIYVSISDAENLCPYGFWTREWRSVGEDYVNIPVYICLENSDEPMSDDAATYRTTKRLTAKAKAAQIHLDEAEKAYDEAVRVEAETKVPQVWFDSQMTKKHLAERIWRYEAQAQSARYAAAKYEAERVDAEWAKESVILIARARAAEEKEIAMALAARAEAEKAEALRAEQARAKEEAAKAEAAAEVARAGAAKAAYERDQAGRAEYEKAGATRAEAAQAEQDKAARAEEERAEAARDKAAQAERDRAEAERAGAAAARAEGERLAAESAAAYQAEAEKAELERRSRSATAASSCHLVKKFSDWLQSA